MKKKPATRIEKKVQFRIEDEDESLFLTVAILETGKNSIPAWAYEVCRARAKKVMSAVESGEVMELNGKIILKEELKSPKTLDKKA